MKNTLFITLTLMMFAIGNAHAYDLMGLSPSHHILYLNILDAENHTVGVTYPVKEALPIIITTICPKVTLSSLEPLP